MSRLRNVCFTSFENEPEFTTWGPGDLPERVRYLVYQREVCPETERRHWQGYVEFNTSMRMRPAQRLLGDVTMHVEKRRGNQQQAADYCKDITKRVPGTEFVELGQPGGQQGKRSDLSEVGELLLSGTSVRSIAEEYPTTFIRYGRGISNLGFMVQRKKTREFRKLEVLVYYGDAGVGKTRKAVTDAGESYFILCAPETGALWWDGYEGDRTLIIDDFYGWIRYGTLLRILDGYQLRLAQKGSHTYAEWTRVVITSNEPPERWYTQGCTPALRRRISSIIHMENV